MHRRAHTHRRFVLRASRWDVPLDCGGFFTEEGNKAIHYSRKSGNNFRKIARNRLQNIDAFK